MTFEIIKGDLFDPVHNFAALAQGVNTFGLMGAGIAVPFRTKYPEMYEEYKALCQKHGETLGGLLHIYNPEPVVDFVDVQGVTKARMDFGITIYNLFSQISPGKDGSYTLLKKATILMLQDAEQQGNDRVGLPWIGCGIAGLERHNVQHIFETVLGDSEVQFILVEQ